MFRHGEVALVTNRMARGLPLVPTVYINLLIFGILARAKFKHPRITVCAWLFLANHYHGVVLNRGTAADMKNFMHYVDAEVAKIVCKLLGRWNTKIWAQRYHYAPIQTAESVMEKMQYLFVNPVEAYLVETVAKYPGVSTFAWVKDLDHRQTFQWIKPSLVEKLPNGRFRKAASRQLATTLQERTLPQYELLVEPFAWKECFRETSSRSDTALQEELLERIAGAEREIAKKRRRENRTVCNIDDLIEQNPYKHYVPKKYGRRAACISSCLEMRAEYIRIYKDFCEKCCRAWQRAKESYAEVSFPAGAFIPPQLPRANAICFIT